jgi:hypothetical protein
MNIKRRMLVENYLWGADRTVVAVMDVHKGYGGEKEQEERHGLVS